MQINEGQQFYRAFRGLTLPALSVRWHGFAICCISNEKSKTKISEHMKRKATAAIAFALAGTISLFSACKKDDQARHGNITVRMIDAPGDYQQVNVEITKVRVHLEPASGNEGWVDLPTTAGVYDLLKLQNGIDTTIVNTSQLPAGRITQMRLLLGSNNTIMIDSVIHPMTVPSGTTSGIKLVGGLDLDPNQTLDVLIDFDAAQSVVESGNGKFHLKPVIKVVQ